MKLAIIGSRTFNDYLFLKKEINKIVSSTQIELIISGGAIGADALAEMYAKENKIPLMTYTPMYNLYGKAAPIQRNKKIVDESDIVVAFWDGVSKGTKSAITYAQKQSNTKCIVIKINSI